MNRSTQNAQQQNQQAFDLIIAGGGVVGLSLAIALTKCNGLSVAIVESAKQSESKDDGRSVALSANSLNFLTELGVDFAALGGGVIEQIQVTDQGHMGQVDLNAEQVGVAQLGRVVSLHHLNNQLYTLAKALPSQIHYFDDDKIASVNQQLKQIEVSTDKQKTLSAKLLAVCEGGQSVTRRLLNIGVEQQSYQQFALIADVMTDQPAASCAYERFTTDGPLALLPLNQGNGSGKYSLVWSLSEQNYQRICALDDKQFLAELQQAFGYRTGCFVSVSKRNAFPLSLTYASEIVKHRVALLGNAAQTLHPIAGQGLNLALRDVQALAQSLFAHQSELGEYKMLKQYQVSRQRDRQQTISATDWLVSAFSNQHIPLVVGRNIGLTLLQHLSFIKDSFALSAMGLGAKK